MFATANFVCCLPFNYWPEQRHEANRNPRGYIGIWSKTSAVSSSTSCVVYVVFIISYNREQMLVQDTTYFRYSFALKVQAMLYAVHDPKLTMYEAMRKDTWHSLRMFVENFRVLSIQQPSMLLPASACQQAAEWCNAANQGSAGYTQEICVITVESNLQARAHWRTCKTCGLVYWARCLNAVNCIRGLIWITVRNEGIQFTEADWAPGRELLQVEVLIFFT